MGSDVSVHKYGGWVGGSEKVQKPAYVIYEWSPSILKKVMKNYFWVKPKARKRTYLTTNHPQISNETHLNLEQKIPMNPQQISNRWHCGTPNIPVYKI